MSKHDKRRTPRREVVDEVEAVEPEEVEPEEVEAVEAVEEVEAEAWRVLRLNVPLAREIVGNVPHRCEVQLYAADARLGLARLRQGLAESKATRADGAPIESHADALRWLLAQFGAGD